MSKKRLTIKDVANAAGLGVGTTSRAINNQSNVSSDARERVIKAAEALGYWPNAAARSLRTRRTNIIGYIQRDIANPLFSTVAGAVERAIMEHGFDLIIGTTFGSPEREMQVLRSFVERNVDALILSPGEDDGATIVTEAARRNIPMVALDREAPGPADRIITEHASGVCQAVSYLLDLGHRDIALIIGSKLIYAGRARYEGYVQAFANNNLAIDDDMVCFGEFSREYGRYAAERLLGSPKRPTALILGGAPILLGALPVIHALGLEIPEQLSIICCDDIDLTQLYRPPITVVRRDMAGIGTAAAALLIDRLLKGREVAVTRRFPTEVVLRASCREPPRRPD